MRRPPAFQAGAFTNFATFPCGESGTRTRNPLPGTRFQNEPLTIRFLSIVGQVGIEPANARLKVWCLDHLATAPLVDAERIELSAPSVRVRCAPKLRYAPRLIVGNLPTISGNAGDRTLMAFCGHGVLNAACLPDSTTLPCCLRGGSGGIRTRDLGIDNAALHQLSYAPI